MVFYLFTGVNKKTPSETTRLAECIGDVRSLLWKILAESQRHLGVVDISNQVEETTVFRKLADRILTECHQTFVACFHAFYPTSGLKWTCLCALLSYVEPVSHLVI